MFAADQERWSAQSNARSGPIVRFIWHHQAGTNDDATIGAMVSGSRQVSATWTVDNQAPVGAGLRDYARITAVVPEDRRPWTSASRADDGALTVECANSTGPDGDPPYSISDASFEACARLAAYAEAAYGIPLQRATAANGWRGHMGHKEVVGAFGDGYATACPMNLDIDRILDLASGGSLGGGALQPTTPPLPEQDDDMPFLISRNDGAVVFVYCGVEPVENTAQLQTFENMGLAPKAPYKGMDPDPFALVIAKITAATHGADATTQALLARLVPGVAR